MESVDKAEPASVIATDGANEVKTFVNSASTSIKGSVYEDDPNLVDFVPGDPENPLNWPASRKWSILVAVSMMNMISVFVTTTIIPAAPQVMSGLHVESSLYRTLLVSILELGEGIGPFFTAPLAERFGRMPVYHIGNGLAILCSVACALSVNISMLVAFRFLNGAVFTALTLGPAITGDLFRPEERGTAMTIGLAFQFIGPFVAPVTGSYLASSLGWRWTLWINVIAIGFVSAFGALVMRETYTVKILERKAKRLREETGNPRLRSKLQAHNDASSIFQSVTRPMQLFFRSPTVALITLYAGLAYGLAYIVLTTITEIMESQYNFGRGIVGLAFFPAPIGSIIGLIVFGFTSDRYIKYKAKRSVDGKTRPEHRLVHMIVGSSLLPLGFLLYGWTLAYHVQWMVPFVASALIGFSIMLARLPSQSYLVDAFEIHSASASAISAILRALSGALLPLMGPTIYKRLGLGWGNSVLALIAAAFIPPLVLLVIFGARIRGRRSRIHSLDGTSHESKTSIESPDESILNG